MLFVIEVIYNKVNFFENSWVFIRYLSDEPIYALILIIFSTILHISLLFHLLHHKTFLFSATKIQCPAICWGSWLVRYQSNELLGLIEMTCSGKNIYHTTINCFHDLKAKVILDLKLLYPSSTNPAKLQADRRAKKCHYWASSTSFNQNFE